MSTEEDKARFDAQCYLTQLWMNNHKSMKKSRKSFRHVKEMSGQSALIMNLLNKKDGFEEFKTMSSLHASFLTPMIRLWKTRKGKDTEFYFEKGSYEFSKGKGFKSIFSSLDTRGTDVGIESVDVEFLATQPAEVDNHISVNLKMYFKNFNALVKTRRHPAGPGEYRFSDLIIRPLPKGGGVTTKTGQAGCNDTPSSFNAEEYQIKLMVGWNLPDFGTYLSAQSSGAGGAAASIVSGLQKLASVEGALKSPKNKFGFKEGSELGKAIRNSTTLMHLTLKNHTFNFNMDGSFTLDIEYHAWAKASMSDNSANIFFNHYAGRKGGDALAASVKNLKDQKSAQDKRRNATTPPGSKPGPKTDDETEEEEEALEAQTETVLKNKLAAYRRIFEAVERKTQTLLIPKEAVINESKDSASKCTEYKKFARLTDKGVGDAGKKFEAGERLRDASKEKSPDSGDVDDITEDNDDVEIEEEDAADWQEELSERMGLSGDFLQVHYVFLGDIIDSVYAKLASDENPSKKKFLKNMKDVTIILGPANVENPCDGIVSNPSGKFGGGLGAALGSGIKAAAGKGAQGCRDNETLTLRLANMPVLYENFTVWFKNNIIKQQKDTYRFNHFLKDIFNGLLKPSLGSGCNEYATKSGYVLNFDIVDMGELPPGMEAFGKKFKKKTSQDWMKAPVSNKVMKNAVIMHTRAPNYNRKFNKTEDQGAGIYHLELGQGDGIIKTFSFSKNDAPYLAEAKTLGGGAIGSDLAGGAIYNFSCEMLGNGFFKPGQLIYVNPKGLERGNAGTEVGLKEIRLGGYYVIDSVKLEIKNGDFITSIEAIYQSSGGMGPGEEARFKLKTKAQVKALAGQNMAKYIYTGGD